MPLDVQESFTALLGASALAQKAQSIHASLTLNAGTTTAVSYAQAFGLEGAAFAACEAYDKVKTATVDGTGVSVEEFIVIVGIKKDGILGELVALVKQLLEDVKD